MGLEIRIGKAYKGDSIWIRYGEKKKTNILIDSGPASFSLKFKEIIYKIKQYGENIDLLILTHIDNDHIMGFKKYISNGKNDFKIIKNIWLNGEGSLAYRTNQQHSPNNITKLVDLIKEKNINLKSPIYEGHQESINGALLKVITPKYESILKVAQIIDKHNLHKSNIGYKDIDEIIISDKYKCDCSDSNEASISFVFLYKGKKIAFLGDAHAEDVIYGKNKYFLNEKFDLVKIAHHGSKYNTSYDLLNSLKCEKFIISSKGPIDKETIARITNYCDSAIIYCNYEWWKGNNYFSLKDKEKYITNKRLVICEKTLFKNKEDI